MMTMPPASLQLTLDASRKRKRDLREEEGPRQEWKHRRGKLETTSKKVDLKQRKEMVDLASLLFFQQVENKRMCTTHFHELREKTEGFYFDEKERVAYLRFDEAGLDDFKTKCFKRLSHTDPIHLLVEGGNRYHNLLMRKSLLSDLVDEKDKEKFRKLETVEEVVSCLRGEDVKFPLVTYNSSLPSFSQSIRGGAVS